VCRVPRQDRRTRLCLGEFRRDRRLADAAIVRINEEGDVVDKSQTYSGRRVPYTWGQPVDAAGETAAGRAFADIAEFKKLLLEDPRAIARNMVGQLVTYGNRCPDRVRRPGSRRDGAR